MKLKEILNLFVSPSRGIAVLGVLSTLLWTIPAAALTITQNTNIASGQTTFGPATTLFNWTNFFSTGTTWSLGALGPVGGGGTDPRTGNTVTGSVNLRNWIDGDGFNSDGVGFNAPSDPVSNRAAAPDLAIDGLENFSLQFTNPVTKIGFAVATGLSNLPSEVDHLGAIFQVTTNTGDQGTLTLIDLGLGYSAWVTIASNTPFHTLTFLELSGTDRDQYFGNFVTAVPEPMSFALMFLGLLSLFGIRYVRRQNRR